MSAHLFQSSDDTAHLPSGHRRTPPNTAELVALSHPRADTRMVLALQRTAGNAAVVSVLAGSVPARSGPHVPAWVQRVTDDEASESEEDEASESEREPEEEVEQDAGRPMSIGARTHLRGKLANTRSPRLRGQMEGGVGPSRRGGAGQQKTPYEKTKRGIWNGSTRPSYDETTWDHILGSLPHRQTGGKDEWQCKNCSDWLPKWQMKKGKINGITIDHKVHYKKWINEHAAGDKEGQITNKAAKDAYNDLSNLVGMCRDCNSSKNAERGVWD